MGVLVWHILPPVHLLMPNGATSPCQHIWYAQPGQIPKAMDLLLQVRWTNSVSQQDRHLADVFVPSIGLDDIIAHLEPLTKST